jgi:hypothetical protein
MGHAHGCRDDIKPVVLLRARRWNLRPTSALQNRRRALYRRRRPKRDFHFVSCCRRAQSSLAIPDSAAIRSRLSWRSPWLVQGSVYSRPPTKKIAYAAVNQEDDGVLVAMLSS